MAQDRYDPSQNASANPYIDAGQTQRIPSNYPQQNNADTAEAAQNLDQAAGQQVPNTQQYSSREPVPSPPQQSPYIPEGEFAKGSTQEQPLLRPKQARAHARQAASYTPRPVATPNAQAGDERYVATGAQRRDRRPRKRGKHWFLSLLLWLIMAAVCILLAIRTLPVDYSTLRFVPELASFVPLSLIPTVICLVLAFAWHRRLLVLVCLAALTVNCYWHAGYFFATNTVSAAAETAVLTSADTSDSYARIMTINTLNGQASAEDIVRVCREQNVEVLCLQEMTDGMVSDLENAGINDILPYSVVSEGASMISNGGRNAIYTAAPTDDVSRNLLPIDTSSMPAANIQVGNQTVRIVSVHPNSPIKGAEDLWDEGLSVIGSLSDYNHSYLIMGDFNSTWDHVRFRTLLGSSFVDASQQSGEGFHMTYPSESVSLSIAGFTFKIPSLPLIEIDHIVYSKNSGIVVSSLETVSISGTDHKALLATLEAK